MSLTFFDNRGGFLYEFVPTGKPVNQVHYLEVLETQGNDRTFCQQLMDLASRQCTCSHGTLCEGVFSY